MNAPPPVDRPNLNPMPTQAPAPAPAPGGGPVALNPMPGGITAPVVEPPLRLNAMPGGEMPAPPPGVPLAPPAVVPGGFGGFAGPPPILPSVAPVLGVQALSIQAAPQAPPALVPVIPVADAVAVPPPPPPPPPPATQPYFISGVHRNERGHHVSRTNRHYTYRPPTAQHPIFAGMQRFSAQPSTLVPPLVDLRGVMMAVRNQSSEGACTGFAATALREALHAVATGARLPDYLSPAYLYGRTRMYENTFPRDSGASISDEMLMLVQYGVCPEAYLPYTADPAEAPTPACDTAAAMFRIAQPIAIDFRNPISLKAVLAAKQPIAMSFTVYESFEEPDSKGRVAMFSASEKVLGAHGVLLSGYNDNGWIIRNHWGEDWADGGYCYMPMGYEACFLEAFTATIAA
jgi:hypothetical protein